MVALNANMTDSQGWIPLSAADAAALVPGYYTIGSESVTAEGIHRLGPTLIGNRLWPYVTDGVWCTRGIAGTTRATHASGAALARYFPDAPSVTVAELAAAVAFDATVPTTQAFGDVAAAGSASAPAHRDHRHGMPAAGVAISALPAVATPAITDLFIVNQSATSKKLERSQMMAANVVALPGGSDAAALVTAVNSLLANMKSALLMAADVTYASLVMGMANLAGYWRMGEAAGTAAADEKGLHAGTHVNTPTVGATGLLVGDADLAVTYAQASTEYTSISANKVLAGSAAFSITAWVKFSTAATTGHMIWCERGTGQDIFYFGVTESDGKMAFAYRDDAGTLDTPASSTGGFADGATHFLCVTKSGTSLQFYADGSPVGAAATLTASDTLTEGGVETNIGRDAQNANWFANGTVDELAIFTSALTAQQIADLYAMGT